MPVMRRIPLDRVPEDKRAGELVFDGTIQTTSDGVEKRRPKDTTLLTYLGQLKVVQPERHLDVSAVMQIGVFNVLKGMTMHRHKLEDIVESGTAASSSFVWDRIFFDMPRIEEQQSPVPVAGIVPVTKCSYEYQSLETSLLDETVDVYAPGTVLRKVATATQQMAVHTLNGHHEERRGVKSAFERTFLAEPDDDEGGRRTVVRQYFDRTVRMYLRDSDYPGTAPREQANKWESVSVFDLECDVVYLVEQPTRMQSPINDLQISGSPIISAT